MTAKTISWQKHLPLNIYVFQRLTVTKNACAQNKLHTRYCGLGSSLIQEIWGLSLLFGDTTIPVCKCQGLLFWTILCTPVIWPTLVISEIRWNCILYLNFFVCNFYAKLKSQYKIRESWGGAGEVNWKQNFSICEKWPAVIMVMGWDWRKNKDQRSLSVLFRLTFTRNVRPSIFWKCLPYFCMLLLHSDQV